MPPFSRRAVQTSWEVSMALISKVANAGAFVVRVGVPDRLILVAAGEVPTTGWTHGRLTPRFYSTPPSDGVWDFDFIADPPYGIVVDVLCAIAAGASLAEPPAWLKGVRVHGEQNDVLATFSEIAGSKAKMAVGSPAPAKTLITTANYSRDLGTFEDSHQPTGTIHWKNDGPLGAPNPHPEFKKLVHRIRLWVEGPTQSEIDRCVAVAFTAAALAMIAAAISSGGLGAAAGAIEIGLSTLTGCLGKSYTAGVTDESHWEYWDV
jgi:hypothetical protein